MLRAIGLLLAPDGRIIIQTLHPQAILDLNRPNKNQWVDDSWQGINGRFKNGHPWYFRTLEKWLAIFDASQLKVTEIQEPYDPSNGKPVSRIFVLELQAQ
ncbi:hypothetical protein [Arthrospiribacter ruber]|uniref:Methyltransferase n=1 Tax=Arthrospiribacter ruber TaxID=2487934 RepID=A0A951J038_9BACT|nr:hypothetical protein [Arthrospiribacter ruber]MBW3470280.1 hypothetical protein [Arthrospiribacter ruber]